MFPAPRIEIRPADRVIAAAWTASGNQIVAVLEDGWVYRWRADDGSVVCRWPVPQERRPSALVCDGDRRLWVSGQEWCGWLDLETGEVVDIFGPVENAGFFPQPVYSPALRKIAFQVGGHVFLAETDDLRSAVPIFETRDRIETLRFSDDGAFLLGLPYSGKPAALWDLSDGTIRRTFRLGRWSRATISNTGDRLLESAVSGSRPYRAATLRAFDAATGRQLGSWSRDGARVATEIAFDPKGEAVLALAKRERDGGSLEVLRVVDLATGHELAAFELPEEDVLGFRFSPDGDSVAIWSRGPGEAASLRIYGWSVLLATLRQLPDPWRENESARNERIATLVDRCIHGVRYRELFELRGTEIGAQATLEQRDDGAVFIQKGKTLPDVRKIWWHRDHILSTRAAETLRTAGWSGFELEPATVLDKSGNALPDGRWRLRVTHRAGRLLEELRSGSDDYRLLLDLDAWDGSDFFHPANTGHLLVTPRVVERFRKVGLDGWRAIPVLDDAPEIVAGSRPPERLGAEELATLKPYRPARRTVRRVAEALDRHLTQFPSHAAERIRSSLRPALRLTIAREDRSAHAVGASRWGGDPDLPAEVVWPSYDDRPMEFLAQFRLEDLTVHGETGAPGLISVFVCADDFPALPEQVAVLLFDGTPDLERRLPPSDDVLVRPTSPLRLTEIPTLPHPASAEAASWRLAPDELAAFGRLRDAFRKELRVGKPGHQWGGWPDPIQDDDPLSEHADDGARRLLIQLDTDDELGIGWGDAGMLYLTVPDGLPLVEAVLGTRPCVHSY